MSTFYTEPVTGTQIATDVVGSLRYQQLKLDGGLTGLSQPLTGTTQFGLAADVTRLPAIIQGTNPWTTSGTTVLSPTPNITSAGTISGTGAFQISVNGEGFLLIDVTGTFGGPITVAGGVSGGTSRSLPIINYNTGAVQSTPNITVAGTYAIPCAGLQTLTFLILSWTGGTANWFASQSLHDYFVGLYGPLPTGTNTLGAINQGIGNTPSNAWTTIITDGTNEAAVKAASTTPAKIDPALTVSLSPNSAGVPQGTGNAGTSPWAVSGNLTASFASTISTGNSTSTQFPASGGTFQGTAEDVSNYASITVAVRIDLNVGADTTDGLQFQWSEDGSIWDYAPETHTIFATAVEGDAQVGVSYFTLTPKKRYFRLIYIHANTAIPTSKFNIQTIYHPFAVSPTLSTSVSGILVSTGDVAVVPTYGMGSVLVTIMGTWSGILKPMGATTRGVNFLNAVQTDGTIVSSTITNTTFLIPCAGYDYAGVYAASMNSGTASVDISACQTPNAFFLANPLPVGSNVIGKVNQGTSPWTVSGSVSQGGAPWSIQGGVAAGSTDSGNPIKAGSKTVSMGAAASYSASGQRSDNVSDLYGVPFVTAGHPNIKTIRANYSSAQTDTALISVSGSTRIAVTRVMVTLDKGASVNASVIVGFGASNTPTTNGVLASHPGVDPGGGFVTGNGGGILGVGASGESVRITSGVPTGGSLDVVVSYYTVPS